VLRHFCKGGGGAYVDTDCKDCMRRLEHPEEFPLVEVEDSGVTMGEAASQPQPQSTSAPTKAREE
jgi:hypothetical protein